jgi:hypothetical protein
LGGRPRKPTVEEARRAALDELVPKALRVLNEHLDSGRADAWRAALRVFEHAYGRAPEEPEEPFVMPTTVEEVERLSWGQLLYLAGEKRRGAQRHRLVVVAVSTLPLATASAMGPGRQVPPGSAL